MSLPSIPTRTDAAIACNCGGVARISAVAPIPTRPDRMRNSYSCAECGQESAFEVLKKGVREDA